MESRSVFEAIVNNKAFVNVSIILFMNKSDLLKEKVPKSDIRQYFADFTGDHLSVSISFRDIQEIYQREIMFNDMKANILFFVKYC